MLKHTATKFIPGDLVRKKNGKTNYIVLDVKGNYIATSLAYNWTHESKFIMVKDGKDFREELRRRLETYIDEQHKKEAQEEPDKTQSESISPAVGDETAPIAP